ncbi:MAG: acetolactate synthase [Clostridiales bacterium]|nr:acetolactate synthase [Candidatus Equinaster intestinalis]
MIINQLSVFLENKPGRLYAAVDVLAKNNIDISALSLADTSEFGILRLIVNDFDKAREVLRESGVIVKRNHVIAVAMNDKPGGMVDILKLLSENNMSIEYMYACVGKITGKALMVIRIDDYEQAEKVLLDAGYGEVNPADIYRL